MTGPRIPNRNVALFGGAACMILGAWMLHDAYEKRGRRRPFVASFLP